MGWKWNRLQGIGAAIGLLILIFDSPLALKGASSGIELCIKTVIPSLFPFFVLSMVLTNTLSGTIPNFIGFFTQKLGIPKAAEPLLIPSVLGGYPVGAKCISDLYQSKQINRQQAERLLAFSSNAGPAFLFGMVSGFFPEQKMIWLLWFIHLASAVLTAAAIPAGKTDSSDLNSEYVYERVSIIASAAKSMCMVCCWVILFRIIVTFINAWLLWFFPQWVQTLLIGILELTNGCSELPKIIDIKLRFIICSCMLAFGGFCVLLQTASVIHGLSIGHYIKGKAMQTAFSFLLSSAVVCDNRLIFAVLIPSMLLIFRKIQNRDSNPCVLPV